MAYTYSNTLTNNTNGIATAMGKDSFWTNMPARNRYIQQTGLEGADVTMLEMQKYMIDIDSNIRRIMPPKYALFTMLEFGGAGQSIKSIWHTWQDIREGDDQIDQLPTDVLRARDIYIAAPANATYNAADVASDPFAIGAFLVRWVDILREH